MSEAKIDAFLLEVEKCPCCTGRFPLERWRSTEHRCVFCKAMLDIEWEDCAFVKMTVIGAPKKLPITFEI